MFNLHHLTKNLAPIVGGALILALITVMLTAIPALADNPEFTFVTVIPPRTDPPPIPHSDVLDGSEIERYLATKETKVIAPAEGEPGVLETETDISSGLTLFEPDDVCNDFNRRGQWRRTLWTDSYANWATYAADDGYFQAKNVTFDRELSIGPGANYDRHQSSMKIASNQPYEAGVMSPQINVRRPGRTVRVRANYLIYNHGIEAEALDYAAMGVITKVGEPATYALGYERGVWSVMELEVESEEDYIIVMLQAQSPAALNSNIYFDNVQVFVNDRRVRNCRR